MGTSIELTVAGLSLDYSKNSKGVDWGHLFQEGDLSRRRMDGIDYDYYGQRPEEADELAISEEAFIRPLSRVLPRLSLLGYSIEDARAEYEAVLADAASMRDDVERPETPSLVHSHHLPAGRVMSAFSNHSPSDH